MLAELKIFFLPFISFEHTENIVPTVIGLVLLVWLINRFAVPGAKTGLADRATRVETDIRQVDAQLEDVARLRQDYATRIQQIEKEQRQRIDAAVRDADNARAEIIADAQATATLVRRRGEEELGRERTRQRILLRQQMVQLTLDAAEQAVRAQNTDAVQRHLIRHFIGQVSGSGASADSFYPTATQNGTALASSATALLEPETVTFVAPVAVTTDETPAFFVPQLSPELQPEFKPEHVSEVATASNSEVDVLPEGTAAFGMETPAIDFTAPDDTPASETVETGDIDFTTPNFGEEIPDFRNSETEGGA